MPGSARLDQKRTDIEGHSTAAVCWDGAVVLADMLCLPPAVLLQQNTPWAVDSSNRALESAVRTAARAGVRKNASF